MFLSLGFRDQDPSDSLSSHNVILNIMCYLYISGVVKTVCPEGEWRCDNGQCLSPLSRCDGRIQCSDKSDEAGCHYNTTPRKSYFMSK